MNKVFLLGRMCGDVELRTTTTGKQVAQWTIAVDRPYKDQNGQKDSDFFNIVLWGKTAEVAANGLKKGHRVLVEGRIQNRSFDGKDGQKKWITEIIAERFDFIERRENNEVQNEPFGTPMEDKDKIPF